MVSEQSLNQIMFDRYKLKALSPEKLNSLDKNKTYNFIYYNSTNDTVHHTEIEQLIGLTPTTYNIVPKEKTNKFINQSGFSMSTYGLAWIVV